MPYLGNPAQQRFSSPRAASVYSGDGSTVAFTLEEVVSTDEDILVSVDGVIQEPSVAYAVSSGTTLTFTAAPSSNSGNNIFVYYIARTFGSVSMPDGQNVNAANFSASGTGAITGNATVTSNAHKIVSVNGVMQEPSVGYTVNGSTITFGAALVSADVVDFITAMGEVGNTTTVSDASINTNKLGSSLVADDTPIRVNDAVIDQNVTIASTKNAFVAGPVRLDATVTIDGTLTVI